MDLNDNSPFCVLIDIDIRCPPNSLFMIETILLSFHDDMASPRICKYRTIQCPCFAQKLSPNVIYALVLLIYMLQDTMFLHYYKPHVCSKP